MKRIDMRFEEDICQYMIDAIFSKYRCDKFDFTNSGYHSKREGVSMNQYCVYLLSKNDAIYSGSTD